MKFTKKDKNHFREIEPNSLSKDVTSDRRRRFLRTCFFAINLISSYRCTNDSIVHFCRKRKKNSPLKKSISRKSSFSFFFREILESNFQGKMMQINVCIIVQMDCRKNCNNRGKFKIRRKKCIQVVFPVHRQFWNSCVIALVKYVIFQFWVIFYFDLSVGNKHMQAPRCKRKPFFPDSRDLQRKFKIENLKICWMLTYGM